MRLSPNEIAYVAQAAGFSGDDLNMMPILEYIDAIREWLASL